MADHLFAYLSPTTHPGFLNAPPLGARPDALFVVAGIPWDGSTTNRPGARFGPYQIRRASHMLCDAGHPVFDLTPSELIADVGDLPLPNTSIERMRAALAPLARELVERHHMVWLGGDHSITLPLLRAYRDKVGRALALVHFDAHCDTWPDHAGEPSGHGTWVYEAVEEGLVDPTLTIQIGLRSAGAPEIRRYIANKGGLIYTARDLRGLDGTSLDGVMEAFRARLRAPNAPPVYLSFDIDALDPAYAPGTGTPEPGGLTTSQALTLLEGWSDLEFIGMDLCEVSPPFDHAELTSNAASTLVWTYISGQAAKHAR
jgi:agmatinase